MSHSGGSPNAWMRDLLREWLPPNAARPEQLADWLRGRLPPVGDDDEPYVWILRGLPTGGERKAAEEAVAEALAALLRNGIDRADDVFADKMLYNLFQLAAGISWPDALCEPLDDMVRRKSLRGRKWLGMPLTGALRAAVIENQLDARHAPMWLSMLAGHPHPYLGGSPNSGFDGILWMPESPETRGRPALTAIGQALRCMVQVIDSDPELQKNRDVELRSYIERVRNAYPGRSQVTDEKLIGMAEANRWPTWACDSLALIITPKPDRGFVHMVLPQEIASRAGMTEIVGRYCDGRIVIAKVPQTQLGRVEEAIRAQRDDRRADLAKLAIKRSSAKDVAGDDTTVPRQPPLRQKRKE